MDPEKKTDSTSSDSEEEFFDKSVTFKALGVCEELLTSCDKLGYKHPTKIQSLKGRDIIGLAETGSGKTLAFVLPMLQNLLENPRPYHCLIIAPARELCLQINEHIQAIGKKIGIKSVVVVGGLDLMAQSIALVSKKPHVIVCTPGRLLHHLENTKGFNLDALRYLILDEADKILAMDFEKQLDKILENIPKKRRTMLFSATMTNKVSKLQRASLKNPVKVEVSTKNSTVKNLKQNMLFIPHKYKDVYLVYLMNQMIGKSILIFVITCKQAIRTTLMLRNLGFDVSAIHGKMSQVKRMGSLNKFKSKERKILIATDVASRGIDIPSVDVVMNFDIPQSYKDYIHRVGRTARAGKSGLALSIVNQYDVYDYQKIEHSIKKKLDVYPVNEADVLMFYERVQEAQRIADYELKQLIKKKMGKLKNLGDKNGKQRKRIKKRIKLDI